MSLLSLSLKLIISNVVFDCVPVDGLIPYGPTACTVNAHCDPAQACHNGYCINPCLLSDCGDPHALCYVSNHLAKCECKAGFVRGRSGCEPICTSRGFENCKPGFVSGSCGCVPDIRESPFEFVDLELPWEKARSYCSQRGMKLATIESAGKKTELEHFIRKIGNKERWTPQSTNYDYYPLPSRRFKFELQATYGEGHLAFSKTDVYLENPIVELSVGSYKNKWVTLNKNHSSKNNVEEKIKYLVSSDEFRGFWVDYGRVYRLGKENKELALINWVDPEPFYANFFGIHTGKGSFGKWSIYGETVTTSASEEGSSSDPYHYTRLPQFSLDIAVRASEGVRIALTGGPQDTLPMYEIILGGWGNTASAIRYNKLSDKVRVDTPGLLSSSECTRFRISWKNGLVNVLTQGGESVMKWQSEEYVEITHYGLMSPGGEAWWSVAVTDDVNGLATTGRLWLGGGRPATDDQFLWLGSGQAVTSDWYTGSVNTGFTRDKNYLGHCLSTAPVVFGENGTLNVQWFKADCFTEFKFICEHTMLT